MSDLWKVIASVAGILVGLYGVVTMPIMRLIKAEITASEERLKQQVTLGDGALNQRLTEMEARLNQRIDSIAKDKTA
jgi:hypothetical protein